MQCNSFSLLGRRAFLQLSGFAAAGACLSPVVEAAQPRAPVLHIRPGEIELAPCHRIITTTYNGQFPGPTLRATVGQPFCVDVCNDTDTTERVHWQGQELADAVVPPHSRRRMEFTPSRVGLYLYHSEVVAAANLRTGLYSGQVGALLVEPRTPDGREREWLVVLKGCEPFMRRTMRGCEVGYRAITVNGRLPGHGVSLRANTGERILMHALNAGATESYTLELPNHVFEIVALDGIALAAPQRAGALRLSPGERISAHVVLRSSEQWIVRESEPVATRFDGLNEDAPDGLLPLVLTRHAAARSGLNRWSINGAQPTFRVRRGALYRLQIHNTSDEHIPLHLQRHRLQVNGVWKDVVVVGPQQRLEVDFRTAGGAAALLHCTRQLQSDFGLRALIEST
ncbi:MAG: multicopper oxidase domain-containing protein [Proteobacteria bacterium]|nr:multicopper oxidase domain-containing protein [Pseudomonadota bacterium]